MGIIFETAKYNCKIFISNSFLRIFVENRYTMEASEETKKRFGEDSDWMWDHYYELMKKYPGKFVIIVNKEVKAVFNNPEEAMNYGMDNFGYMGYVCGIMNGDYRRTVCVSTIL